MDNELLKTATARFQPCADSKSTKREQNMALEMDIYRKCFIEVEPNFDPSKSSRSVLNTIFAWVWKYDPCNALHVDYNKGFFLYGTLGRGKTLAMLAMRQYMNSVCRRYDLEDYRLKAWMKSASELANIYAADGQPSLIKYAAQDVNIVIDEFGREPIPASCYGTKMNVIQFLLQLRYDNRRSSVTHITTNLTPDSLEPLYGNYVADRCKEMFNFIEFRGESLR